MVPSARRFLLVHLIEARQIAGNQPAGDASKSSFWPELLSSVSSGGPTYPACAAPYKSTASPSPRWPGSLSATSSSMPDRPRRRGRRPLITIKTGREEDGGWIAEVLELPDVVVYADTETEARAMVVALALQVLTTRIRQAGGA